MNDSDERTQPACGAVDAAGETKPVFICGARLPRATGLLSEHMRNSLFTLLLGASFALSTLGFAETKAGAKPLSSGDKQFVKSVAEAALGVLHLTEVVAPREGSPGSETVKAAGKTFATDVNTAWGELGAIATDPKDLPKTDASASEKKAIADLKKLPADKFDKPFLKALDKDSKRLAKHTEEGAKQVQSPELKAWAEKWAPGFKTHAEEIGKLEASESKKK